MSNGTHCCIDGTCTMPLARWHGTAGGYNNHYCRCDACRKAWADYFREGNGRPTLLRYRRKVLDAGKVLSGGLSGPDRKYEYQPRPNATGARPRER
jgi:hypothetical protein